MKYESRVLTAGCTLVTNKVRGGETQREGEDERERETERERERERDREPERPGGEEREMKREGVITRERRGAGRVCVCVWTEWWR